MLNRLVFHLTDQYRVRNCRPGQLVNCGIKNPKAYLIIIRK